MLSQPNQSGTEVVPGGFLTKYSVHVTGPIFSGISARRQSLPSLHRHIKPFNKQVFCVVGTSGIRRIVSAQHQSNPTSHAEYDHNCCLAVPRPVGAVEPRPLYTLVYSVIFLQAHCSRPGTKISLKWQGLGGLRSGRVDISNDIGRHLVLEASGFAPTDCPPAHLPNDD